MSESKNILEVSNPPKNPESTTDGQDTPAQARLSRPVVETLAGAVAQLVDINERLIKQPNDAKLSAELQKFIATTFLQHAQEFIGCWFTVRLEYEPLCQVVAHVLGHTDAIRQQRYQQARALEKQFSEAAAKLKESQETNA